MSARRGRRLSRLIGRRVLAVLFPERCAACGEVIPPAAGMCPACTDALPRIGAPVCLFCGMEQRWCRCRKRARHFDRVVAPFYYESTAARGVLRMKSSGDRPAAAFFAREMAEVVRRHYAELPLDGIVFVPTGGDAWRERGFNPSERLATELADELALPVWPLLCKVMENRRQKALSASERTGNVLGVFDVTDETAVRGKTFLLVDDIVTTGSTLDECAKMLKIYGAAAVYAVVATATHPESTDDDTKAKK